MTSFSGLIVIEKTHTFLLHLSEFFQNLGELENSANLPNLLNISANHCQTAKHVQTVTMDRNLPVDGHPFKLDHGCFSD